MVCMSHSTNGIVELLNDKLQYGIAASIFAIVFSLCIGHVIIMTTETFIIKYEKKLNNKSLKILRRVIYAKKRYF